MVAVYETHEEAEQAICTLQAGGVDMRTLSIAAKDTHLEEHVTGFYSAGDRMMYWGKVGAFWGAIWGLLFDSALFAIPGIGPVLLAGPLVAWVVAVLEGAVVFGGIGVLGAGLMNVGVPKSSVLQYEAAIKSDKFLLIVHGIPVRLPEQRLSSMEQTPCTAPFMVEACLPPDKLTVSWKEVEKQYALTTSTRWHCITDSL